MSPTSVLTTADDGLCDITVFENPEGLGTAKKDGGKEKGYESGPVSVASEAIKETRTVTVLKLSGADAFGPSNLECASTIKDLKTSFEPKRPKGLMHGADILDDDTTLQSLPQEVSLIVNYT